MRAKWLHILTGLAVLAATVALGAAPASHAEPGAVTPGDRAGEPPLPACTDAAFVDVPVDHPFCSEIAWLVERDLAEGFDDGTFRPTDPVSRQAMAAFLFRYLAPADVLVPEEASFVDVPLDHQFSAAIEWMVGTGLTTGYDDGTFRPTAPVSRQATAAFLFRLQGPEEFLPEPVASFTDVSPSHPFFAEIEWLAGTAIATGYDDGTFRPTNAVSRQAIAAFVQRYDAEFGEPVVPLPDGFVDPAWFDARQMEYLEFATEARQRSSALNLLNHLERAERDPDFTPTEIDVVVADFPNSWNKFDNYLDTADFDLLYLINLWLAFGDELTEDLREGIEQVLIDFKYWFTDPSPEGVVDERWYWSENHQIIFHALEYLAGQELPDEVFTVTGLTGAEHRDRAAERIDAWLEERVEFGFSEWHSNVYYQKDVTPLLTLVEWADDPVLVERAAMMLDVVLLDLAVHTLEGNNGATAGRSYMKDKSIAPDQDVFGIVKLLFDQTDEPYVSRGEAGASLLSRAKRYRLPQVVYDIANTDVEMVDRTRMGVSIDLDGPLVPSATDPYGWERPEAPFGRDFDDPENVTFWWERGALTAWPFVPLTLDTIDQYDLWDVSSFQQFDGLRGIITNPDGTTNYNLAIQLAHTLRDVINVGLLEEINSYTYRTGDVMLSSAQSYRPGAHGNQYHAWQATLGSRAVVFTTHPGNEPRTGNRWVDPDLYWTGTGSMPYTAQEGPAAIHIYAPAFEIPTEGPFADLLASFRYLDFTHAWFPTEEFDEVVEDGNWIFGRKGDGYVALWSWRETEWRTHGPDIVNQNGLTEVYDLVAPGGPDNVWITEVGDATRWAGGFEAFQAAMVAATPEVTKLASTDPLSDPFGGFDVVWNSPTQGQLEFGTAQPFVVAGNEVALDGYPRLDNPWMYLPFGGRDLQVTIGERRLDLDFDAWSRSAG